MMEPTRQFLLNEAFRKQTAQTRASHYFVCALLNVLLLK